MIRDFLRSSFSLLQMTGKALMLPVAVLPIAGLLLGIGSANFSILPEIVSSLMAQAGGAIFGSLPILFAVGIAIAASRNDGVAALSAIVGYVVLLATMGAIAKYQGIPVKPIMGIDSINTGVFGGIVIGFIAAAIFNRFYRIQLPPFLGFFAGKRSVPIITSLAAVFVAAILSVCWPPIGAGIQSFSHWAASGNPAAAFSLYGFVERLLIPFGLHHIWNVPFFFEAGEFLDASTGKVLHGEIPRYIAGDPTAGNLAGGYLFKMWGLPAAALAIWRTSKPEYRSAVGGIMISAALTSFITGITEPIEFSFMFLAPLLYFFHAVACAGAYWLCIVLGIKHGMTFSHGLIDFLVLFPQSSQALWFFVLGPLWALGYYTVFHVLIQKFGIFTFIPEMESSATNTASMTTSSAGNSDSRATKLIQAFGGSENISGLDACITRLRVQVKEPKLVNSILLKELGATAVLQMGASVQAIFGTASENLKTAMEKELQGPAQNTVVFSTQKTATVSARAPLATGQLNDLEALRSALGGAENIQSATNVASTRVRVQVKNPSLCNPNSWSPKTGQALQEIRPGLFHLIIGTDASALADELSPTQG